VNIVLLLIAVANLSTDIVRLALEWSPSHKLHGAIKEWMIGERHDSHAWVSDVEQNGLPQRGTIRRLEPSGTLRPWPYRYEVALPRYQMPLPGYRYRRVQLWCLDCYRPAQRYEQRFNGW
jgi:hypothetical protein